MREHFELHNANVARSVHTLGTEATAAYEGAREKVAAVHRRPVGQRGDVHEERHRGDQPGGVLVPGASLSRGGDPRFRLGPGRRDRHLRDGAPLQHRAVAAAVRADRRHAALVRHHRPRPAGRVHIWTSSSTSGPSSSRSCWSPTSSGRPTPPPASTTGSARSARCSCSTPPRRCRTGRSTSSATTSTSSPSPATRCSARPASACSGAGRSCWRRCRRSSAAAR